MTTTPESSRTIAGLGKYAYAGPVPSNAHERDIYTSAFAAYAALATEANADQLDLMLDRAILVLSRPALSVAHRISNTEWVVNL